jgi:hypothetical protein
VQLGTKIEVYATLIGLLNVEDYNFVGGLLQLAASAYSEAWQELDVGKATALLRLLAAPERKSQGTGSQSPCQQDIQRGGNQRAEIENGRVAAHALGKNP